MLSKRYTIPLRPTDRKKTKDRLPITPPLRTDGTGQLKEEHTMKHTKRSALSLLLALCFTLGLLPALTVTASAVDVSYLYYASEADAIAGTTTSGTATATPVTADDTAWGDATSTDPVWYVVNSDVTNANRITVSGAVNLILADGFTLTASAGIGVSASDSASLTIYAQSTGNNMGALTATGDQNYAGIGSGNGAYSGNGAAGTITVNGGTVTATGGNYTAGIGGGYSGAGGTITVNGGAVTATGGIGGTGIGGGMSGAGGTITFNGGTITAIGQNGGAGIGGGAGKAGGTITVNGGTVTATGGSNNNRVAAGIGGGSRGAGGTITVNGGTVTATGGNGNNKAAAGIGGGDYSACGTIIINDGTVTATGGSGGAGIGGGYNGKNNTDGNSISITGGIVTATVPTGTLGAAIGCGDGTNATDPNVTIGAGLYVYAGSSENSREALPDYNPTASEMAYTGDKFSYMAVSKEKLHVHVLSNYALSKTNADNDTITADCTGTDGECGLTDKKASLTISMPEGTGKPAVLTDGAEVFGASVDNITYEKKDGGGWTSVNSHTEIGEEGFYRASITLGGLTASVTFGLNCIAYSSDTVHGSVSGNKGAMAGEVIKPVITPETGYEIDTLTVQYTDTGTAVSVTGNESFIMPEANVTVSATFKLKDYAITFSASENGSVSAKVGDNTATTAKMGDTVTLTAAPNAGYELDTFTVKDADNNAVTVTDNAFTMPASNVTVSAAYSAINYTVTIADNITNGTVNANKTTGAHIGDTVTLTVAPDTGYELDALTVKDASNSDVTVTNNAFTMPASNVTVSAAFKKTDYTVTIADSITNGTVTLDKATANYGDTVTLTTTPVDGYALKSLTVTAVGSNPVAVTGNTFTMPASNVTVTAVFDVLTPYTIFYRASGNPDSVRFRMADSGDEYEMTRSAKLGDIDCWALQISAVKDKESFPLAFSTDGGSTWGALTDGNVVNDIPSNLAEGSAVAIEGEAKAFAVAFIWGENTDTDSRNYLVTSNTQSVNVPNPTDTASKSFKGWTYLVPSAQAGGEAEEITVNKSSGNTTTVPLDKVSQTTIASANWMTNTYTVSFNPDNGTAGTNITVDYGNKVAAPNNPTKAGYEFVGWVVAGNAVEKLGNQNLLLSIGTEFDFENISIINNLRLLAIWKHVHAYVCLQLDDQIFEEAFKDYYGYKDQLHIKLCTRWDSYWVEAHNFVNGKCACGAVKATPKVTLTKTVDGTTSKLTVIQNQVISISAPTVSNNKKFARWEYSGNGTNWYTLTTNSYTAFSVPQDMYVRAVYEPEKVTVSVQSLLYEGRLAFYFSYSVPDGWKVIDGGILTGYNQNLCYTEIKYTERTVPYYLASTANAVSKFGAATVGERIFQGQAISGGGTPSPDFRRPSVLGKTASCATTYPASMIANYNGNFYLYGVGYIVCQKPDGSKMGYKTDAIWASKNSPDHITSKVWAAN